MDRTVGKYEIGACLVNLTASFMLDSVADMRRYSDRECMRGFEQEGEIRI